MRDHGPCYLPSRKGAAVLRPNPPPADGTLVLRRYGSDPKIDQFCLASYELRVGNSESLIVHGEL